MNKDASNEHELIVKRLVVARRKAGLTQAEVAEKLKQTQSYISKIENNQKRIDVLELKKFAQIYEIKPSFLLQ